MSSAPFEEAFDNDSGYTSADASYKHLPDVYFSKQHLKFLNAQLSQLQPREIIQWAVMTIPGLFQETAFGLSGLVTLDILSKMSGPIKPEVDTIFIDTLYHFDETLDLLDRARTKYPGLKFHVYKPLGMDSAADFEDAYGKRFWETNEEQYDFNAKVEPARRAYSELNVKAVLTGRRRTQGGKRSDMGVIEIDESGLIKVNPLLNWSFEQVSDYIHEHDVPYNPLLDAGYKSVGDWHSTQPVADGEDERAGRWKGREKTECGIHNPQSRYAQYLAELEKKEQQERQAQTQKAMEGLSWM